MGHCCGCFLNEDRSHVKLQTLVIQSSLLVLPSLRLNLHTSDSEDQECLYDEPDLAVTSPVGLFLV
jgi:hypothetical protein